MNLVLKYMLFTSIHVWLWYNVPAPVGSPKGCYAELYQEGMRLMQRSDYENAIKKFTAAGFCTDKPTKNDLDQRINQAHEAREQQLLKALAEAERSTKAATQAQAAEAKARQQAEDNERIAATRGRTAEGLRLALLAENERLSGNRRTAWLLAYLSLQLVPPDSIGSAQYVFGKTVRDSLGVTIARSTVPFVSVKILADSLYLAQLADGQVLLMTANRTLAFPAKTNDKTSALFAKNQNAVIICDTNHLIHIYNLNAQLLKTLPGHQEEITFALLSPDETYLLTGSRDNTARLWNLTTATTTVLAQHQGNVYSGAFSTDGQYILLRASDTKASLWDSTGKFLHFIEKNEIYVYDAAFSPQQSLVLTGAANGNARLWDERGVMRGEMQHTSPVKKVFFSPDGQHLLTVDASRQVSLWDITGKRLMQWGDTSHQVSTLAFSEDGAKIAIGTTTGSVAYWSLEGRFLQTVTSQSASVQSLLFSPNAEYLLAAAADGTCKLWDRQGNLLMDILTNNNKPFTVSFSPDSRALITTENDNRTLRRYPLPTVVYQTVALPQILKSADYQQLKKDYQIQFIVEK